MSGRTSSLCIYAPVVLWSIVVLLMSAMRIEAATELSLLSSDFQESEMSVMPGEELDLQLIIDVGDTSVNGISVLIQYDSTYVRVLDANSSASGIQPCRHGSFLPGLFQLQNALDVTDPGRPRILYSIGTIGGMANGSGVVAELSFEVLAPIDTTRLEIAVGTPVQTQYSVAGDTPRTETFDRLVSATLHIPGIPDWDVNEDGAIDILDMVVVGRHFGEALPTDPRADVNADGAIDILDMVTIGRHFGEHYRN